MKTKLKDKIKFGLIFLVGLLIFSYPMISQKFYEIKADEEIIEFVKQSKEINEEEINKRMELARAYNETLDPSRLSDPYSKKEEEARAYYAHMLDGFEDADGCVELEIGAVHHFLITSK